MAKVDLSKCSTPEWLPTKTKKAADKINAEIDKLAAIDADVPGKRDALLADALAGKVTGAEFITRRKELSTADMPLIVTIQTAPLYAKKLALLDEVAAAAKVEAERLDELAAKRRGTLENSLKDFEGRPADKEALLRSDKGIQKLKTQAVAARAVVSNWLSQTDREWARDYEGRVRIALGLRPAAA